jgi:murein DD-endopeptidase MepM/ murein hydrolase activator NlpD
VLTLAPPCPAAALDVRWTPSSPALGDVAMLVVPGGEAIREIEGTVGDRPVVFFRHGAAHAALYGVDLEQKPGKIAWRVVTVDRHGARRASTGSLTVRPREFSVQRLSLPTGMVDLDPATERRVTDEAARLRALYASLTPERLWRGAFVPPVAGDGKWTGFGARRIINGQPRMPHSGVDYSADRGTAVVAANRGRVAMVGDFFFAGRLVIVDHGLGLYTLYFHLDRIDAAEGAVVERGEAIGTVGATGRATGPHLHWGAVLRQARIDPLGLLSIRAAD